MDPRPAQLRLLPAPQPLVERLGAAFFRSVPHAPGVYRMFDAEDRLVYVGKAKDLHARLASYRRTHGQSRKTIRLIHTARRVEWELCASDTEARLRENLLIRTLRPRFNRAGIWPKSARFIQLDTLEAGFRITVVGQEQIHAEDSPGSDPGATSVPTAMPGTGPAEKPLLDSPAQPSAIALAREVFGAFRGGAGLGMGALARLLWLAWNPSGSPASMPRVLLAGRAARKLEAAHAEATPWRDELGAFLAGESDALIGRLAEAVPIPSSAFDRAFVAADFETLQSFFRQGPLRTRRLRGQLAPDAAHLAPEQLDDLLVLAPSAPAAPAFRPPE